ncbi:MAG: hypothetical protein ACRDVP_09185 [Acidimicrobiales bacterium]
MLGLTWIVAGALQFQPFMFSKGFLDQVIAPVAHGQPAWIAASITWSVHLTGQHHVVYNALFAATQVLIGAGLLVRRSVKPALAVSFGWALGVWWFGEGLGLVSTGTVSPLSGTPGAVIIYALVGALVWPHRSSQHSASEPDRSQRRAALAGKLVWAGLWMSSAALWLLPANREAGSARDAIGAASYGWLARAQHAAAAAASGHGLGIAIALAGASALIALGIAVPATARPALVAGVALSLAFWAFGQGFGMITTGTATDVNAGPLYVLLALRLWGDPAVVIRQTARLRRPRREQQPQSRLAASAGRALTTKGAYSAS